VAIRAIIWDLDGVVVNSMEFHYAAFREVLAERDRELSREEYFDTLIGLRNDDILRRLLGELSLEEIERLNAAKEESFRRRIADKAKALPGAAELVRRARQAQLRQAVVSSTARENIGLILDSLKLTGAFDAVVGQEDATRGKPDPQGFQIAAERLGVAPAECIVIEDAPEGIAAGKAAGMRCIGVTTTRAPERLSQADLVVGTLEDKRVWEMLSAGDSG
jgi:beta-phosphoglucomutase